jgi:Kdo2-lipid IVA lauroyltransferase/acyltransferase
MYYLLLAIFYPISYLPFPVLYLISDGLYFVIYKIIGYRKEVSYNNLKNSFPEKTEQELQAILKQFYKNLCDNVMETIKLLSISRAELDKRLTANWDVLNEAHATGRVAQGHLAHLFNWEWGTTACNWNTNYDFTCIYSELSSPSFERLMMKIRTRSKVRFVDMDATQKLMATYQKQNTLWGIIADQNPSEPRRSAWVDFLGRKTAFFKGAELMARRYNNIVLFGEIVKVKRGYYRIDITKMYDNARETADGEITETYVKYLEECIKRHPENWVWSHRRWKHVYQASSNTN